METTLSLNVRFGLAMETSLMVFPTVIGPSMLMTDGFHAA